MLEHSQHLQTPDSVPVLAIEQLVDRAIQNTNCRVSHSICSHCVLRHYWLPHRSWWLWFHDYVIVIRGEPYFWNRSTTLCPCCRNILSA